MVNEYVHDVWVIRALQKHLLVIKDILRLLVLMLVTGPLSRDRSIEVYYPVKNLISQRCHGEIIIYSQLSHMNTSMQSHCEATCLSHHDINR